MTRPLTVAEVAELTGLDDSTIRLHARRGTIPGAMKLVGCWRFDRARLERWLAKSEVRPWPFTSEVGRGGSASVMPARKSGDRLTQALDAWRRNMKSTSAKKSAG